ncbi:MAG TPA: hypothetical protein VHO25_11305 [Polyangiaceae bacterium]|nr:hypothetical protein [Polyangiaceae bacterium]
MSAEPNSLPVAESSAKEPTVIPIPIDGAHAVQKRKVKTAEAQQLKQDLNLQQIDRPTLQLLNKIGIDARAIGITQITDGSILATHEGVYEAIQAVRKRLEEAEGLDCESLCMAANAMASLAKANASMVKASGASQPQQEKATRGRRSFPKGVQIGPLIEAKPANAA